MTIFSMAHDYNYMNPIFFSKTKEILGLIKVRSDESWLIFVRNKNVGEHIQQELTNYGLQVDYITADTEKDDIAYCELLEKEHLPGNILITTRVLDVGINVKGGSPKAFNIVVYEDDIVEIQQMIGRKRVEKNEILNVYFYIPSLSELEKRRISVFYRDMEFGRFKELSENGCYLESIHPPFFLEGNMLKYNNFFPHKVANDIFHYNDLINKISEVDGVPAQQIRYAEEMLSNFEGITVNESPVFITDLDKELKKLLRETDGKTLLKGEFETFSQCIKTLYGDPRSKKRDTPLGVNNVKSILKELGYILTTAGNPVTYTIEKEGT